MRTGCGARWLHCPHCSAHASRCDGATQHALAALLLQKLVEEGKVRHLGLSEVSAAQVRADVIMQRAL